MANFGFEVLEMWRCSEPGCGFTRPNYDSGKPPSRCPKCKKGKVRIVKIVGENKKMRRKSDD